jgi:hypothetical protein
MWRAVCFLELDPRAHKSNPGDRIRLTTERVETKERAEALLTHLLTLPGVTGGDVEVLIPGPGWVLENDVETIQILARTREPIADPATDIW